MTDFQTFVGSTKNYRTGAVESAALDSNGRVVVQERSGAGTLLGQTRYTPDEAAAHATRILALLAAPPTPPVGRAWAWDAQALAKDPQSDQLIKTWLGYAFAKRPNVTTGMWGVRVYHASATSPLIAHPQLVDGGTVDAQIPFETGWAPDPSGDGHLLIVNADGVRQHGFWQARLDANGRLVSASSGRSYRADDVNYPAGWGDNAACVNLRHVITAEAMKQAIAAKTGLGFTLQFSSPLIGWDPFRYPATKNSPTSPAGTVGHLVEGMLLRAPRALDPETVAGISEWERVILRTLCEDGMVLRDNGGAVGVYAMSNPGQDWAACGMASPYALFSTGFPWPLLEVTAGVAP